MLPRLSRSSALVKQRISKASSKVIARGSAMVALPGPVPVTAFIEDMNTKYEQVHKNYEDNFWSTKMALQADGITEEQKKVLHIMEKTFKCYITEDPTAAGIKDQLNTLEGELQQSRNYLAMGYTDATTSTFVKCSSVALRNIIRVNSNEATRKSAYEGMRSIGPFVAEKFVEIIKLRNKLAKLAGFEDFYDYKVSASEGFGKRRLFEILDDLERQTRPINEAARKLLAAEKGEEALQPYNMPYALSGDTSAAMDPYFPFEDAVDIWARTFAALGIHYKGSVMRLDLCDREGKYPNGFCHWPQPAWRRADGEWVPSTANFTSLAIPNQVGSGKDALVTLLHEGGHAAHLANVDQRSPFFSQERAPTSVAYAENQSMFLDAYEGDAAWLARYAKDRSGKSIPWEIVEQHMRAVHPYKVFQVRAMLVVPYFEKELYEMAEEDLNVESLLALADRVEKQVQGGLAARPLMSVPHILSDESSCYYHGYILAEMSVHQTRAHFKSKYGQIVDNPQIGKDLTEGYWQPGNGAAFLDLVHALTGQALTAQPWVQVLQRSTDSVVEEEHRDYLEAVKAGPKYGPGEEVELGMQVVLVHGDEVIADSATDGSFQAACKKFKGWVQKAYPTVA